jgi:hypothetical protein
MHDAADRAGDQGLAAVERDAMVASLLGITPDRLRTMRRVHSKRVACGNDLDVTERPGAARARDRWLQIDRLDDEALCAAMRRREALGCGPAQPPVVASIDRTGRRSTGRR